MLISHNGDYQFFNIGGKTYSCYCITYKDKAVMITELGKACAPGTAEAVAEAEGKIVSGELHVFDASTFTIGGETPTSILGDVDADFTPETECLIDGYFHESEFRSAPYFAARIDGITELN